MAETAKRVTVLEIGVESPFQIPVSVKKIRTSGDIPLDSASPSGNPIRQISVDLVTGEPVESDEKQQGIFRSKPKKSDKTTWSDFAPISADDIEVIEDATKLDTFQIEHFIPLKDVPFERVTDAYFLAPAEGASAKPLVLLARALRKTKRAGVFKLVKTSRQYLAVVYEQSGGLIVNTLAYSGDFAAVREAAEALDRKDVKISAAETQVAAQLVEAYGADADVLDGYEDDLIPLKADLVERALKGERLAKKPKKIQALPTEDDLEKRLLASVAGSASKRGSAVAA